MNAFDLLKDLERFEGSLGVLYDLYARRFQHDRDANKLFLRLSREEFNHRDLARYQQRLLQQNPMSFGDVPAQGAVLSQLYQKVMAAQQAAATRQLAEAVAFAWKVEHHSAEQFLGCEMSEANPALAGLFHSMAVACRKHRDRFVAFARSRGFAPEPPPDLIEPNG